MNDLWDYQHRRTGLRLLNTFVLMLSKMENTSAVGHMEMLLAGLLNLLFLIAPEDV